jgi:LmbE family N-acetylglucosaminyl deacetylase
MIALRVTWILAGLWLVLGGRAGAAEPQKPAELDVLVVAPHSDDEAIGCTAIMLRAIARGERVGIVIVTAGDGFPKAAAAAAKKEIDQLTAQDYVQLAALRQSHTLLAMKGIGIDGGDLMFLGYPDGGLEKMYSLEGDKPYQQPFTGREATYGRAVADYHSRTHGRPAPYVRASLVDDLAEIIKARRPAEMFVTDESDSHGDHRATLWFVRDAVRAAGYQGPVWTFVVHGRGPTAPPDRRLTLSDAELKTKREVIELYQVGVSPVHDRLAETYARPEELFWKLQLDRPNGKSPD